MKYIISLSFILFFNVYIFSQEKLITGNVLSKTDKFSIEGVNVSTFDSKYNTETDSSGHFEISIPNSYNKLFFSKLSLVTFTLEINTDSTYSDISVILEFENEIEAVNVSGEGVNSTGIVTIDSKIAQVMPSLNEGIESLIKTQAGVIGSRNEMSSQYSVRGGNFDENLVYVNGVEIYRPQLIRAGEQEGLSFINPMMISSVNFSAGGFEAKYGDKTASVLDIKYKMPNDFSSAISFGLLGASIYFQNSLLNDKLKFVTGLRYKTNQYLLNSLETQGEYKPSFIDFQTFVSYDFNKKINLNFLANFSDNNFTFFPESRETHFGTITRAYGFFVLFDGREKDRFYSYTGAVTLNYKQNINNNYSLIVSGFKAVESESFDIISAYSLNELNRDFSTQNAGDSLLNLGTGYSIRHARNMLYIDVASAELKGAHSFSVHNFNWGLKYRFEYIQDKIDEWEMLDSAGYSIPYNSGNLVLFRNVKSENKVINQRAETYFQDKIVLNTFSGKFEIIGGIRFSMNTLNNEFFVSPRLSAGYKPQSKKNTVFRFAFGVYNQPSFYKEMRMFDGSIVDNSKIQKSIHFVLGNDFEFEGLGRKLLLRTEIYYKKLNDIIPFEIDNVRVKYYANQRANGYAAGIDAKISGEFVPGVDSWFSLSVMKTEEDIYNIGNNSDDGFSYIPRPTDQRVNASLFLQDYIPGNKRIKAHLNLLYGTGFHFGPPEKGREYATNLSPDYKRVDLGASAVIIDADKQSSRRIFRDMKSFWITLEVLNLLDVENTISYSWLRVVPNTANPSADVYDQYAVPNHLTARLYNLKISIEI